MRSSILNLFVLIVRVLLDSTSSFVCKNITVIKIFTNASLQLCPKQIFYCFILALTLMLMPIKIDLCLKI